MTRLRPCLRVMMFLLAALAACAGPTSARPTPWTLEDERALRAKRADPSTWDVERMANDLDPDARDRPMRFGAFPVPHYDLTGDGYKGGGNRFTLTPWRDRQVVGMGFFMDANEWNAPEVGDLDQVIFVHLLVPMAEAPSAENVNLGCKFSSRNHPHLTAQGWFETGAGDVEYVAFQAANGAAWALVNMRLFDLRVGRCLLVAPQPDGTLRTMQLEAPRLGPEELQGYHSSLLEQPEIDAFLATSLGG